MTWIRAEDGTVMCLETGVQLDLRLEQTFPNQTAYAMVLILPGGEERLIASREAEGVSWTEAKLWFENVLRAMGLQEVNSADLRNRPP